MDNEPEEDVSFIQDILGKMPEPMQRVFDIYMKERVPIDVVPQEYPYNTNEGWGFTEEEARAKLRELNGTRGMRLSKFTFTIRLRGFENIPKCEDQNDWGDEDGILIPKEGPPDPDFHYEEFPPITQISDDGIIWKPIGGLDEDEIEERYSQMFVSLDELEDIEEESNSEE